MLQRRVVDALERVGDEDFHAEPEADRRQMGADGAVPDDAHGRAVQLAAHAHVRLAALTIGRRRVSDAPRQIDHESDRDFGYRGQKSRRCLRDQHARPAGGVNVDVADVERAAQESDHVGRLRKERGRSGCLPVGNDDLAATRRRRQGGCVEHLLARIEAHLTEFLQCLNGALAVIVAQHLGGMGKQDASHEVSLGENQAHDPENFLHPSSARATPFLFLGTPIRAPHPALRFARATLPAALTRGGRDIARPCRLATLLKQSRGFHPSPAKRWGGWLI